MNLEKNQNVYITRSNLYLKRNTVKKTYKIDSNELIKWYGILKLTYFGILRFEY